LSPENGVAISGRHRQPLRNCFATQRLLRGRYRQGHLSFSWRGSMSRTITPIGAPAINTAKMQVAAIIGKSAG
jgi:hypothetical protein